MAEALGRLCHAASTSAKASRPASPRGTPNPNSPPTGTPHAAPASAATDAHTASVAVTSTTRNSHHKGAAGVPVVHSRPGSGAQGGKDLKGGQGSSHAGSRRQSASPSGGRASHGSSQHANATAVTEGTGRKPAEVDAHQRSKALLADLHAAEGGAVTAAAAADGCEQSQSTAGGEEAQSSVEGEQSQCGGEGEQTRGAASEVEGVAVGGAAGMVAALQRLDAQAEEASELLGETQAESSIYSGEATQDMQHQSSSSGSRAQSEGERPTVHSSMKEAVAATAVGSESEGQAGSDRGEASGSPGAASAGSPAIPSLVVSQVSGLLFTAVHTTSIMTSLQATRYRPKAASPPDLAVLVVAGFTLLAERNEACMLFLTMTLNKPACKAKAVIART